MYRLVALAPLLMLPLAPQDAPARERQRPKPAVAKVGAPAPAFRLNDHRGKFVRIGGKADHWTVVAFYPKALTGG